MSYDLYFRSRPGRNPASREDFVSYFARRPFYELGNQQALYSNEDTGVYFSFEYNEPPSETGSDVEGDPSIVPIAFNLNYYRPHTFGLEAEPELQSFIQHFDFTVSDPQMSGMGDGEYTREGFLRGWNAGNEFAYRAIRSENPGGAVLTLPSGRIETYWLWNYRRQDRQQKVGDSAFVPRLFFFDADGKIKTGVAWADGIPILLPEVDLVLVPRDQLAPRRWLRSKKDIVLLDWGEIERIVENYRKIPGDLACYELFYDATPLDIRTIIRRKKPPTHKPEAVSFDRILDEELVRKLNQ